MAKFERQVTDFEKYIRKDVSRATRAANNAARTAAYKCVKDEYPGLPRKGIRRDNRGFDKRAKWREDRDTGEATLTSETAGYSVVNVIVGSRKPEDQTGKKIRNRRKYKHRRAGIKDRVGPGKFITKMRAKNWKKAELVSREKRADGETKLVRETFDSVASVLNRKDSIIKIEKAWLKKLREFFTL